MPNSSALWPTLDDPSFEGWSPCRSRSGKLLGASPMAGTAVSAKAAETAGDRAAKAANGGEVPVPPSEENRN